VLLSKPIEPRSLKLPHRSELALLMVIQENRMETLPAKWVRWLWRAAESASNLGEGWTAERS
jgi:hypothetical protein